MSIQKKGKSYVARYRGPDGKQRSRSFKRKLDAQRFLDGQRADMHRGSWIDPSGADKTFAEWWETYNEQATKRISTRVRDQGVADTWLLPTIGKMRLGDISPTTVQYVIRAMTDGGLAPSTVRTYYGVLRAALNAAVDADLIGRSPCRRGMVDQGKRRADPRFLTLDELHRLADVIDPNYRAMVYLAGLVGLRFGECAGLRVGRVDFFRRTVSVVEIANDVKGGIVFGEPKTAAGRRTITMPRFVVEELSAHLRHRAPLEPDDLVFTSPWGEVLSRKSWRSRFWLPAVRAAELEGLTFHGLRHTAAGFMIEKKVHGRVMQLRLGHAEFRTTMDNYGSVAEHVEADVADDLDDLIDRADDDDQAGGEAL